MEFINIINKMEELKKCMEETPWSIIPDPTPVNSFYDIYKRLDNYVKKYKGQLK
jgi:hypothetical protein